MEVKVVRTLVFEIRASAVRASMCPRRIDCLNQMGRRPTSIGFVWDLFDVCC
jgi:hypothetical protein